MKINRKINRKKRFPKTFTAGCFLIGLLFFLSCLSFFIPYHSEILNLEQSFSAPSLSHPFGLDENGRSVFLQIMHGARVSLTVALSVTAFSFCLGLLIGSLSGFSLRLLDPVLMRVIDMIYAFPHFLLALALMSALGASVFNLILVMSLSTWASYARLVRGEILHLRKKEFILSAEALGVSWIRKVLFHVWPNLIGVLAVQTTLTLASVVIAESGLSFLGIGVPPEIPTWGSLLREGRPYLIEAPHLSLIPGFFLFVLILGFHLLGEGLRDSFTNNSPNTSEAG